MPYLFTQKIALLYTEVFENILNILLTLLWQQMEINAMNLSKF